MQQCWYHTLSFLLEKHCLLIRLISWTSLVQSSTIPPSCMQQGPIPTFNWPKWGKHVVNLVGIKHGNISQMLMNFKFGDLVPQPKKWRYYYDVSFMVDFSSLWTEGWEKCLEALTGPLRQHTFPLLPSPLVCTHPLMWDRLDACRGPQLTSPRVHLTLSLPTRIPSQREILHSLGSMQVPFRTEHILEWPAFTAKSPN